MVSGFAALMYRMNYINRWGLMRNARSESLAEHSLCTAYVAHILACLANTRFDAQLDADKIISYALYHDASEIMTGDLPTPVKYSNDAMRDEYKQVESLAVAHLIRLLPDDLASVMEPSVTGDNLNQHEKAIVKAADKICAYIKCMEEESAGNSEFSSAGKSTLAIIMDNPLPETRCFVEEFIPAFSMTLDELLAPDRSL